MSLHPIAINLWHLRTHEFEGGQYGDPWVGVCTLRAERWIHDEDFEALARSDEPRPYAHMFATTGQYSVSAHRVIEELFLKMGFWWRYHERAHPLGM